MRSPIVRWRRGSSRRSRATMSKFGANCGAGYAASRPSRKKKKRFPHHRQNRRRQGSAVRLASLEALPTSALTLRLPSGARESAPGNSRPVRRRKLKTTAASGGPGHWGRLAGDAVEPVRPARAARNKKPRVRGAAERRGRIGLRRQPAVPDLIQLLTTRRRVRIEAIGHWAHRPPASRKNRCAIQFENANPRVRGGGAISALGMDARCRGTNTSRSRPSCE